MGGGCAFGRLGRDRAYIKGARKTTVAAEMVEALKRIEADFTHRHDLVESVLEELKAAEYRLMRR